MSDVEIVARVERRRKWTPEEKAALLAEVVAEGGKVKPVARRHRIAESLLYNGRSAWRAAAEVGAAEVAGFRPVGVIGSAAPGPVPAGQPVARGGHAGAIEIALPNGVRVRVDTGVDEAALLRVLRSLRGMA
jgi:transposase